MRGRHCILRLPLSRHLQKKVWIAEGEYFGIERILLSSGGVVSAIETVSLKRDRSRILPAWRVWGYCSRFLMQWYRVLSDSSGILVFNGGLAVLFPILLETKSGQLSQPLSWWKRHSLL